ncbi:serine/threonine-protein phosphatase [Sesbania bispinosa]|nr:serine/threonine-protein phosphatase [Sesbania bispinosa]
MVDSIGWFLRVQRREKGGDRIIKKREEKLAGDEERGDIFESIAGEVWLAISADRCSNTTARCQLGLRAPANLTVAERKHAMAIGWSCWRKVGGSE